MKSLRDRLTSPDFRAKILIASSLSYRNRLAKQILSLRHRTVKLEGKKIQALDRRNAIRSSISDLEPRVLRTVTVAKKLRSELETLISSSLNDRKIKIMSYACVNKRIILFMVVHQNLNKNINNHHHNNVQSPPLERFFSFSS